MVDIIWQHLGVEHCNILQLFGRKLIDLAMCNFSHFKSDLDEFGLIAQFSSDQENYSKVLCCFCNFVPNFSAIKPNSSKSDLKYCSWYVLTVLWLIITDMSLTLWIEWCSAVTKTLDVKTNSWQYSQKISAIFCWKGNWRISFWQLYVQGSLFLNTLYS